MPTNPSASDATALDRLPEKWREKAAKFQADFDREAVFAECGCFDVIARENRRCADELEAALAASRERPTPEVQQENSMIVDLTAPKNPAPWPDPTSEMLNDPRFEAVWQCIKSWDINVPSVYGGYCGATGNHVRAILDALAVPPVPVEGLDLEPIKARVAPMPTDVFAVEDQSDCFEEELRQYYWDDCPHGCASDECEGHYERRVYVVDGLLNECVDDACFFSKERADFAAHAAVDVRALIAAVESLRARLAAVEGQDDH